MDEKVRRRLQHEAAQVRGEGRGRARPLKPALAPARAFLYLVLITICVGGSLVLLLSESLRSGAVAVLAGGISGYVDPGEEIFPLPAPRPDAPRTIHFGGSGSGARGGDDIIYDPGEVSQPDPSAGPEEFVPAARTAAMEKAYAYLIENSELAGRLSRNEVEGYSFKEWNPRDARDPVFLVDMVMLRQADSQDVTLVFQVDLANERVRAVNQAARDLERVG